MPDPETNLIPPDFARCQAVITTGAPFMQLGGTSKTERCKSAPDFIAIETAPGPDGRLGSMSLCAACKAVAESQLPASVRYTSVDHE